MTKTALNILFFLLIAVIPNVLSAQNPKINATQISHLSNTADEYLGQDSFGFSYQISNNVFRKFKGSEVFEYKNVSLGRITKTTYRIR